MAALAPSLGAALVLAAPPPTMRAVRKGASACGPPPDFGCVSAQTVATPRAGLGEVLIRVAGSGVNPDELSLLRTPVVPYTPGWDVAGTVVEVGDGCSGRVRVGDRVWTAGAKGGWAEYATREEWMTGVAPQGPALAALGTMPTAAMTSLGALLAAGAPWAAAASTTVLITAGNGGTGYTAVQLAKALGAARVVTAATGDGIALARSLGADTVVDFKRASVFSAVANRSVDVVLANHDSATAAAAAMTVLRASGGVYVSLQPSTKAPNGTVPAGVRSVDYDLATVKEAAKALRFLDQLAGFLSAGSVRAVVQETYDLDHAADALKVEAGGAVLSKLSVVPTV